MRSQNFQWKSLKLHTYDEAVVATYSRGSTAACVRGREQAMRKGAAMPHHTAQAAELLTRYGGKSVPERHIWWRALSGPTRSPSTAISG